MVVGRERWRSRGRRGEVALCFNENVSAGGEATPKRRYVAFVESCDTCQIMHRLFDDATGLWQS
jgi:hypothetical protein